MSNTTTNWVLNLVDKITAPMRSITQATSNVSTAMAGVNDRVKLSERDTKEALEKGKFHYKQLGVKIKEVESEIKDLNDEASKTAPGIAQAAVIQRIERAKLKLKELQEAAKGARRDIDDLQ